MSCGVVIPNWNGRQFLGPCLEALRAQTLDGFEIVLVDNASTDDSVDFVKEHFPEVRVVEAEENVGFAAGMNLGIRAVDTELIAFLNNDTAPAPSWLEELVACLERHPRAAAATSKMLLHDRPETIDSAGDGITTLFLPYARGHGARDNAQYEREEQVFSASGGASLWRGAVLDRIGLFDEAFFAYYEDVDLGFRARLAGYECWYAPRAVVRHHRGGSADG
jgi:GT2 family glycosyltransferase